jgi:hypothetical protein
MPRGTGSVGTGSVGDSVGEGERDRPRALIVEVKEVSLREEVTGEGADFGSHVESRAGLHCISSAIARSQQLVSVSFAC